MDIRLALMCGIDIPIPELQTTIHQPTIKEISYIGEQEFFIGLQTLSINKNMIASGNSVLENTTNFQIFMTVIVMISYGLHHQIVLQALLKKIMSKKFTL